MYALEIFYLLELCGGNTVSAVFIARSSSSLDAQWCQIAGFKKTMLEIFTPSKSPNTAYKVHQKK